jgi:hypothetical protein
MVDATTTAATRIGAKFLADFIFANSPAKFVPRNATKHCRRKNFAKCIVEDLDEHMDEDKEEQR